MIGGLRRRPVCEEPLARHSPGSTAGRSSRTRRRRSSRPAARRRCDRRARPSGRGRRRRKPLGARPRRRRRPRRSCSGSPRRTGGRCRSARRTRRWWVPRWARSQRSPTAAVTTAVGAEDAAGAAHAARNSVTTAKSGPGWRRAAADEPADSRRTSGHRCAPWCQRTSSGRPVATRRPRSRGRESLSDAIDSFPIARRVTGLGAAARGRRDAVDGPQPMASRGPLWTTWRFVMSNWCRVERWRRWN